MWWKLHDPSFSRFWLISPCDGQTDGQTDRRNCGSICALGIYAVARNKTRQNVTHAVVVRLKRSETRTWWWADCQNQTLEDISLRSVTWLSIFWVKCLTSQFVIILRRLSNYVLEYTQDRVLQASHRLLLLVITKEQWLLYCCLVSFCTWRDNTLGMSTNTKKIESVKLCAWI